MIGQREREIARNAKIAKKSKMKANPTADYGDGADFIGLKKELLKSA